MVLNYWKNTFVKSFNTTTAVIYIYMYCTLTLYIFDSIQVYLSFLYIFKLQIEAVKTFSFCMKPVSHEEF